MTGRRFSVVTLVFVVLALFGLAPLRAEPNHIVATLVAESATPAPGKTAMLAVAMQPESARLLVEPGRSGVRAALRLDLAERGHDGSRFFPRPAAARDRRANELCF